MARHGPGRPTEGRSARRSGWLEGPILLAWAALGLILLTAVVADTHGLGDAGMRTLLRATAASSLATFTAAFAASRLHRLVRRPATAWLLRNRRWVGLAMALSHTFHLAAIVRLTAASPPTGAAIPVATRVAGSLGYAVLAALVVTSNDRAVERLGMRRWRLLHRIGCWILWLIFALSYAPGATVHPGDALALAALAGVAGLRAWGHLAEPVRSTAPGPPVL